MSTRKGFTLIELMIVVAIIAIIAAVAIPSLLRSRVSSNEASAIASLRTLSTSQEQYKTTDGAGIYADFNMFEGATPPFIAGFSQPLGMYPFVRGKSGFTFELLMSPGISDPTQGISYIFAANPDVIGRTGTRCFYVDETGVIRASTSPPTILDSIDGRVEDANGNPLDPLNN